VFIICFNISKFKPISVADLDCYINHIKTFDVIVNAKSVFLNFILGVEGTAAWQHHASVHQWAMCQNFEPGTSKIKCSNAVH
jgi:hypothetical protein